MKKTLNKSKTTFIALSALVSLIARGQEIAPASHGASPEKKPALTYDGAPRAPQQKSQYNILIEKLEGWTKASEEGSHSVDVSGDELTVRLSSFEIQSTIESVKKVKQYRDAVEKQCKGIDESAALLLNTIDYCLVNNVILPAVNKSKIEQNRFETKLSAKAVNTCHDELKAFFAEKEKRTDLTEKDLFKADQDAANSLSYIFESFGAKKNSNTSNVAEHSELVKAVKKVDASNLCQVKLDKTTPISKDESKGDKKSDGKPKADLSPVSPLKQHKSEYEESIEETIEEEEIYQPLAPKKLVEEQKPAPQPVQQPVYQQPKPTYQPVPYQPAPYKPKSYEPAPAPRPKNNTPAFVPAPAPAPRRALVGGPGPVPVAGVPIARSFGLSLGFGSYNSTVQAVPPPMPYYPPVMSTPTAMPMGGMMGPTLTGVSSTPRACLVCSSTPTVMPTLGLANMIARPCSVQRIGVQPVGACLPNMNQPVLGYTGVNPYFNQVNRYPGAPVTPVTPNQPNLGVGGGSVVPSRTTVPRTTPTLLRRSQRQIRR
ncbi:MAG: hypothetical protein EBQ92_12245 [Proteobacteria bacterium]|nr:hypothetical protein [Pseudomonadota bacterium]